MKDYFVYILTNKNNTIFYIGVTNDLARRIEEHKSKTIPGFTRKYNLSKLVYFESCGQIKDALKREKQLKNWHRDWKINLIKTVNADMKNLDAETSSAWRRRGKNYFLEAAVVAALAAAWAWSNCFLIWS